MSERLKQALRKLRSLVPPTLEEMLCGPEYFALLTASPLQRAVCRIADGKPLGDLTQDPAVVNAVGDTSGLPAIRPAEMHVISGIRTGKSLMAGAMAIHGAQICDVSRLGPGEIPRVSIVSVRVDNARVIFDHILGRIGASERLSALLVEKPKEDSLLIRHPSGRPVEIKVVAGTRAGASLVSRWSAGCIFDEATRMFGAEEGVINYDDARTAVLARMLPGTQVVTIGSPWAPYGPIFDAVTKHWKKPSPAIVIVRCPAWDMNPIIWTPQVCEDMKARDESVWLTDCAAQFANPDEALFLSSELDASIRSDPPELPYDPSLTYTAAMDPATRGNSWTFCIATRRGDKRCIALARQWTGSKTEPLSPTEVLEEIAQLCRDYHINGVYSDQYMGDALRDIAQKFRLSIWVTPTTERQRVEQYTSVKARFAEGCIELPPDPMLRSDLLRVKKRARGGGVQISLPLTGDGRHCDYAPSVILALSRYLDDQRIHTPVTEADRAEKLMLKSALKRFGRKK